MAILGYKPDITNELEGAGIAFGELLKSTGTAVAETSRRLNETGADTTSTLADTLVDVVAVRESIYDDSGTLTSVKSHTRQLPLINFMDPVFYQWTNVRIQGQFFAREFGTAFESRTDTHESVSKSGQGGLLVFLGGGRTTHDWTHTTDLASGEETSDVSFGRMRMNAMLRPRSDITVPKPRQAMHGPNIAILPGAIADVPDAGDPEKTVARTMEVLVEYTRRDGTPIEDKVLGIEAQGVPWTFTSGHETDADGRVSIQLRRTFVWPPPGPGGEAPPDLSPREFVLTVRKGLVANATTVTF